MNPQYTEWKLAPEAFTALPDENHLCNPFRAREPDPVHPLWIPLPASGAPANPHVCCDATDAERIRHLLSLLQSRGVTVFGPLGSCENCGFSRVYENLVLTTDQQVTAVFWHTGDEVRAFGVENAPDRVGRTMRRWSPNLLSDLPLFWCGDEHLVKSAINDAHLTYVTEHDPSCHFRIQASATIPHA